MLEPHFEGAETHGKRARQELPLDEIWPKIGEAVRIRNERLAKDGRSQIPEGSHIDVILKSELKQGSSVVFDLSGEDESLESLVEHPRRSGNALILRTREATYSIEKLPESARH